jgi:hypothetical protein
MVAQLGPLEVREQVVKIVNGTGRGWCDNDVCVGMSDTELLQRCLPPWHLDEDDWTLEGASSYAWPPIVMSTRASGGIFGQRSHPVLRSGAWVMLQSKYLPILPLYNDTRGARYSDNMWNDPQNLDGWTLAFVILLVLGTLCALFRQNHAAHAMLALALLTRGGFQVAIAVLIDTNPESDRIVDADDPYASAHWWVVGLVETWAAIVFYLFEHQFKYVPPILFIVVHLVINLRISMRFDSSPALHAVSSCLLILWLVFQLKRQHVLHQSRNLITDDMSAYNTVWKSLQSAEVAQDLLRIEESVIEMQQRSSSKRMRYQRQRYLTTEEMHLKISPVTVLAAGQGKGAGRGSSLRCCWGSPRIGAHCWERMTPSSR